MIGKIVRSGRGFSGLVNYLLKGSKDSPDPDRVAWTHGVNLLSDDPQRVPTLMRATAAKSRRCEKPAYHAVISWRYNEKPTDALMREVGLGALRDLALDEHQVLFVAHKDTNHQHLHLVVNRVHPSTLKAWHTGKDYARLEQSIARQSRHLGFDVVPGKFNTPAKARSFGKRPPSAETRMTARTGRGRSLTKWSVEEILSRRHQLAPVFEASRSWSDLHAQLAAAGLRLERKGQGIIITDTTGFMKLSDLGKNIRLAGLESQFGAPFDAASTTRAVFESTTEKIYWEKPDAPGTPEQESIHSSTEDEKLARTPDAEYQPRVSSIPISPSGPPPAAATDDPTEPTTIPSRPAPTAEPSPLPEAFGAVSEARASLDMAHAMGSLVSSTSLRNAARELARAQEELQAHLGFAERLRAELDEASKSTEQTERDDEDDDLSR